MNIRVYNVLRKEAANPVAELLQGGFKFAGRKLGRLFGRVADDVQDIASGLGIANRRVIGTARSKAGAARDLSRARKTNFEAAKNAADYVDNRADNVAAVEIDMSGGAHPDMREYVDLMQQAAKNNPQIISGAANPEGAVAKFLNSTTQPAKHTANPDFAAHPLFPASVFNPLLKKLSISDSNLLRATKRMNQFDPIKMYGPKK